MNRPLLAVILGAVLGVLDGASALVTSPEVASEIVGIVVGSTIKGIVCGLLIGAYTRKARSTRSAVAFGLGVGLSSALLVAWMSAAQGKPAWLEIMLPGALLGLVVGFATQRYGGATRTEGEPEHGMARSSSRDSS
jgi:hypothetical protein